MDWSAIRETDDGVEVVLSNPGGCTVDMTIRRLQRFKVRPGERVRWEAVTSKPRRGETPPPQSGTAVVDADGLFILKGLQILRASGGVTLTVKITRAE